MQGTARGESESRLVALAFIGGILTASVIAFAFFVFLGSRIRFQVIWERTGVALRGAVLDMPDELIDELTAMNAVIVNAGNPTGAKPHDTIATRPGDELGWVLRPNVSVNGYQLQARDPVNLDPPVLSMRPDSQMSDALRKYLDENARVVYTYNFDGNGHRRTLPEVNAEKKILMVGDSGLFGVGVDDEHTIASHLQRLVGDAHRVVNAGVGGYGGEQAFAVARALSDREDFDILIYVGHHNDFYEPSHIANPEKARRIIANFESLKDRFPGGIVVALLTYLEYTGADVLRAHGWRRDLYRGEECPMRFISRALFDPRLDLGDFFRRQRSLRFHGRHAFLGVLMGHPQIDLAVRRVARGKNRKSFFRMAEQPLLQIKAKVPFAGFLVRAVTGVASIGQ